MRRRRCRTCLGLLLALGTACPGGAQEARVFGPPGSWPPPREVVLREADLQFQDPATQNFNNLSFHFLGRLDDGTLFTFSVFRWDYALWGGWGLIALVQEPGGVPYMLEERLGDKVTLARGDRLHLAFEGGSVAGADGRYRIRLDLPELYCDLEVQPILPPWQPGDGYAYLNPQRDVYLRTGVHSPWATTSGTVVLRGRTISGQGQCYGDRTRFSFPLARMNPSLVSFRGFSPAGVPPEDRFYLNVLHWRAHEAYGSVPIATLILARGGQWLIATPVFSVSPADFQAGKGRLPPRTTWPRVLRLHASHEGCTVSGQFSTTELVYVTDVLRRLPAIFRPIISVFLKTPVIFRLAGTFRGTVSLPDGSTHEVLLYGQGEYDTLR